MSNYSYDEVIQYIEENDVKFIRLAFCDIFGTQKNISIMPRQLPRAFEEGITFDASSVNGFMNVESSDLLLFPDPNTLSILPWRPSHDSVVRFFCDIRYPDGRPFEGDGRNILRQAHNDMKKLGYSVQIGTECEFYLLKNGEDGMPTREPYDRAGYMDIAPLDRGENVRRQICLTLDEMNLKPEASHHESGPGQNEIDFAYSSALEAADNMITFRSVVKTISALSGLYASFMPKPFRDHAGNGLHINISLFKQGENIFADDENDDINYSDIIEAFMMGIMNRVYDMSIFLNPLVNSYERFGQHEAPRYITWSHQNRSQLIRIPAARGLNSRMELRSPDPCANPYLAFTLIIRAGIEGIERRLRLCDPCNLNLFSATYNTVREYDCLPSNLIEAVNAAEQSRFIHDSLPDKIIRSYLDAKRSEWTRFDGAPDKGSIIDTLYFYKY